MEPLKLHYDVSGNDFTCAGEASSKIKKALKELGFSATLTRKVAIAVYEGLRQNDFKNLQTEGQLHRLKW